MGWIDEMKLCIALEVGGNVTQTLVQAQNAGSKERKPQHLDNRPDPADCRNTIMAVLKEATGNG